MKIASINLIIPFTAIPSNLNGIDNTHKTGYKKMSRMANGQQSESKINHKRRVIMKRMMVRICKCINEDSNKKDSICKVCFKQRLSNGSLMMAIILKSAEVNVEDAFKISFSHLLMQPFAKN